MLISSTLDDDSEGPSEDDTSDSELECPVDYDPIFIGYVVDYTEGEGACQEEYPDIIFGPPLVLVQMLGP